jgi:parallel beta-helix repeat protein
MSIKSAVLVGSIVAVVFAGPAWAGSLNPPGPPSPTMKTIADVDPGKPIHAADLPLMISAPGSFYLAENVTAGSGGISINASGVTIDLRGFTISSDGITATAGTERITVRNGGLGFVSMGGSQKVVLADLSVTGPQITLGDNGNIDRVVLADGVLHCGSWCTISRVRVFGVTDSGIEMTDSTLIDSSVNSRNLAVNAGNNSRIVGCHLRGNYKGVLGGGGVTIEESWVSGDGDGYAVSLESRARLIHVTATGGEFFSVSLGSNSVVADSSVFGENGSALTVGDGSMVRNTLLMNPLKSGLNLGSDCVAEGNTITGTGAPVSTHVGISVSGSGNVVDGNSLQGNATGISVMGVGNTVTRNRITGASAAVIDSVPGNDIGPVGVGSTATSPWANIAF